MFWKLEVRQRHEPVRFERRFRGFCLLVHGVEVLHCLRHTWASPPFYKLLRVDLEKWEWAYLGGLFEGEGNIAFTNTNSAQVRIRMTDKDVIENVDRLVPSPRGILHYDFDHKKTIYGWQLSSRAEVRAFLIAVRPYLGERRRAKVDNALTRLVANLGARPKRTHCPKGHPLSGENVYIARTTGGRSCLACRRERDRTRIRKR